MVHLGANACIVGRNVAKTESMARDIATARAGARVLGIGAVDVRDAARLRDAAEQCAAELGGIDFLMCVLLLSFLFCLSLFLNGSFFFLFLPISSCFFTLSFFSIFALLSSQSSPIGLGGLFYFLYFI
jgi:peroxisomal 2,4-dienoyl-CoA reductase